MTDIAGDVLSTAIGAIARTDELVPGLAVRLGSLTDRLDVGSAAVFRSVTEPDGLEIVAAVGIGDQATAALAKAVTDPRHPIAKTVATPVASFNVLPMAPSGPALRSHLPLVVRRDGTDRVVGVLALAHDRPFDPGTWQLLQGCADLAALAIERDARG